MSKFSKLLEDIDLPGDPFYLQKYRSFHNHQLDTNMMEHNELIMEKDVHRKGAVNILPQGPIAIQELCGKRRREIKTEILENNYTKPEDEFENSDISTLKDESSDLSKSSNTSKIPSLTDKKAIEWYLKYDEDKFLQFEQIERTSTIYKCDPVFD